MLATIGVAAPVQAQNFKVGTFTKTPGTAVAFQSPAANGNVTAGTTLTLAAFNPGGGSNHQ